jgi:hypothetical protein
MKDLPILFKAPMIRAIRAGLKTVLPVLPDWGRDHDMRWDRRNSIHMPRWASRITLEVTGVRVERLQDITEEDAAREGVAPFIKDPEGDCWTDGKHRTAFSYLWNEINGWSPDSFASNPFVWVIDFKRIDSEEAPHAR